MPSIRERLSADCNQLAMYIRHMPVSTSMNSCSSNYALLYIDFDQLLQEKLNPLGSIIVPFISPSFTDNSFT